MLACALFSSWQMDLFPLDRIMQAIAPYPVLMAPVTCLTFKQESNIN